MLTVWATKYIRKSSVQGAAFLELARSSKMVYQGWRSRRLLCEEGKFVASNNNKDKDKDKEDKEDWIHSEVAFIPYMIIEGAVQKVK